MTPRNRSCMMTVHPKHQPYLGIPGHRTEECAEEQPVAPAKKKVAWFLNDLARGGIARYTANLIRSLSSMQSDVIPEMVIFNTGYELDVESAKIISDFCRVIGTDQHPGNMSNFAGLDFVEKAQGSAIYNEAIETCDVVTVAGLNDKWGKVPEGVNYSKLKECVGQIHGVCEWTRACIDYVSPWTDRFVAVSHTVRESALPFVPKNKPIDVIEMSIDRNRIVPWIPRINYRRKIIQEFGHNLSNSVRKEATAGPWILYYGRFAPEKRINVVAETVAKLVAMNKSGEIFNGHAEQYIASAVGVFVGSGWNLPKEREQVEQLLPGRCMFPGWLNDDSLGNMLNATDVFCMFSSSEGGPLTLVEALLAGVPCMATPVALGKELEAYCVPVGLTEPTSLTAAKMNSMLVSRMGKRSPLDYNRSKQLEFRFNQTRFTKAWSAALSPRS